MDEFEHRGQNEQIDLSLLHRYRSIGLQKSLIDIFTRFCLGGLLGSISNEWTKTVEDNADLANNTYSRRLGRLAEKALVSYTINDIDIY